MCSTASKGWPEEGAPLASRSSTKTAHGGRQRGEGPGRQIVVFELDEHEPHVVEEPPQEVGLMHVQVAQPGELGFAWCSACAGVRPHLASLDIASAVK